VDGANTYQYVGSSPADNVDPLGLETVPAAGEIQLINTPSTVANHPWSWVNLEEFEDIKSKYITNGWTSYDMFNVTVFVRAMGTGTNAPFTTDGCWMPALRVESRTWIAIRRGWSQMYADKTDYAVKLVRGVYGHEQRHVQNWFSDLAKMKRDFETDIKRAGADTYERAKMLGDVVRNEILSWYRGQRRAPAHVAGRDPIDGRSDYPILGGVLPQPSAMPDWATGDLWIQNDGWGNPTKRE
jgi:hypothetical protein